MEIVYNKSDIKQIDKDNYTFLEFSKKKAYYESLNNNKDSIIELLENKPKLISKVNLLTKANNKNNGRKLLDLKNTTNDITSIIMNNINKKIEINKVKSFDDPKIDSITSLKDLKNRFTELDFQKKSIINDINTGRLDFNSNNKTIDKYEVIKLLGRGGFGKVKLVKNILTNKLYAMKINKLSNLKKKLMKKNGKFNIHLEKEIALLKKLVTL